MWQRIASRQRCPSAHKNYTSLGLNINATGNFHKAVNDLRDQARRAFYAIKRNIKFNISIRIWLKILESVIEPFMVVRSEGPLTNQKFTKWRLSMQNSAKISSVYIVKTPNNARRAELGWYPLMIKIQKRDVKFYNHLKGSNSQTFHNKAITYIEMNLEKSPKQAGQQSPRTATQSDPTKSPENKKRITEYNLSKLECYLELNREYTVAEYLTTVTDPNLSEALTMYRLSEHSLATWLSREERLWQPLSIARLCSLCFF